MPITVHGLMTHDSFFWQNPPKPPTPTEFYQGLYLHQSLFVLKSHYLFSAQKDLLKGRFGFALLGHTKLSKARAAVKMTTATFNDENNSTNISFSSFQSCAFHSMQNSMCPSLGNRVSNLSIGRHILHCWPKV